MTRGVVSRMIGDRLVTAHCAPGQEALAEDALSGIEQATARDGLHAGFRLRFGWSVLTVQDEPGGGLIVCEPDFDADPLLDTRPRIETTLDVIAEQSTLARRVGAEPTDVGFEQIVLIERGALASWSLNLFRSGVAKGKDSGWTIGIEPSSGPSPGADAFEGVRMYMFLRLRRGVLQALALPVGFAVVLDGDRLATIVDSEGLNRL